MVQEDIKDMLEQHTKAPQEYWDSPEVQAWLASKSWLDRQYSLEHLYKGPSNWADLSSTWFSPLRSAGDSHFVIVSCPPTFLS